MSWFEALILGIVQGLAQVSTVSSSGYLEIGGAFIQRHLQYMEMECGEGLCGEDIGFDDPGVYCGYLL